MKVEYLFSRQSGKLVSELISWAGSMEGFELPEYPSHMAVLLDGEMVVESTLFTGVRIIPYKHWKRKNEEIFRIPCVAARDSKDALAKAFDLWDKGYDWAGILFFAWRYLGLLCLDRPLPAVNRWQSDNRYFCTEYAGSLTGQNLSMKSPARVCHEWLEDIK